MPEPEYLANGDNGNGDNGNGGNGNAGTVESVAPQFNMPEPDYLNDDDDEVPPE